MNRKPPDPACIMCKGTGYLEQIHDIECKCTISFFAPFLPHMLNEFEKSMELHEMIARLQREVSAALSRNEAITLTCGGDPLVTFHPDGRIEDHNPMT